jgi:hypothetical protein
MHPSAILHEVQQRYNVSDRLDSAYRERMRVHPNGAVPVVPSSLVKPRQAVTKAFLCEQILQPRLVRLV